MMLLPLRTSSQRTDIKRKADGKKIWKNDERKLLLKGLGEIKTARTENEKMIQG